ncbi:MAG: hypothetical protein WC759_01295 [Candidatus Micrarchaeia archaeon]|jgi:phenylacetate-CoA ligase
MQNSFALPDTENMRFDDDAIDFMPAAQRKMFITGFIKRQLKYVTENVPYYSKKYSNVNVSDIQTYEDCAELIPTSNKEEIRALPTPYDLLPTKIRSNLSRIYLYRGTGGTTGRPTSMFFSYNDWRATVEAMTRPLREVRNLKKPIISFDGYNQGHISGPIFDDTIRKIGGLPLVRHFGYTDEQAVKQMADHHCNLIIVPPVSTHKGGSLEELLDADIKSGLNYITSENVDVIFHSSTSMTPELRDEVKSLGIKYLYNYYGSTDVLPTAISCQASPSDLHILSGHISLFVINEKGEHVSHGERGLVISGRIASYNDSKKVDVNEATQLLNYHVGDEVTFIDEPCACGRTTPRIRDIKRVTRIKEKDEAGCEVW